MSGEAAAFVAGLVAAACAALRWLRVAQREHYVAGSVTRFADRWWSTGRNRVLAPIVLLGVLATIWSPWLGLVAAAGLVAGPLGLSLRGRTSPLAWTRRLRTLAGVWLALHLLAVAAGAWSGHAALASVLMAFLTPLAIDAALALTAPFERRLVRPFVKRAADRLRQVRPTIVAITGSYGKTSTKVYVAHLLAATRTVVATPASFNNRAGLARAVNEHLVPGTEVFVAEMGTYGRGEIAELCSWCPPDIAVITAVGPVHLERMGSEEVIVEAKAEILERARVAVVNVDHPLLGRLADERAALGQRVVRCSARSSEADVAVLGSQVCAGGGEVGVVQGMDAAPTNVACAVAVALELDVAPEVVAARLATLPTAEHRLNVAKGDSGATVLDDTYNSNPAGADRALDVLVRHSADDSRRVVVTPGMVELGPRQEAENAAFAAAAAQVCSHLVVVGHTNRAALLEGAEEGAAEVVVVDTRDEAVAWVRENVGEGDAVLYENDLPDHFP